MLSCQSEAFPFKYLGITLTPRKLHKEDRQPLVGKFETMSVGWKGKTLSRGGRLTLVNSIFSSMPL